MRDLKNYIFNVYCHNWIWIFAILTFSSCITNRLIIENDVQNPSESIAEIHEKIEVGDWITLKADDKYFSRLQVVSMEGPQMKVRQHMLDHSMVYHDVNLQYIQELKRVETEARYPVGVPVTILIILFYLLV